MVNLKPCDRKNKYRIESTQLMRVVVVGTGYVGLVSGACFADFGHHVTCVDKDETKIASLQRGEIPIFEPDLDRVVQTNARGPTCLHDRSFGAGRRSGRCLYRGRHAVAAW